MASAKDTPAQSVLSSFRSISKALRVADRAGLTAHGLGGSQLAVLHELKQESPLTVNALAERMSTDQSTVSVVVAKLIDKGFVARRRSQNDARRLDLTLTAKGQATVKRLPPPVAQSVLAAVDNMPRARSKALAEGLEEIVRALGVDER